jgi:hypothetical protein
VWRGFSGEGQALNSLASVAWKDALPSIRANLKWQSVINLKELMSRVKLSDRVVKDVLAALGSRGLVGFDLSESAYFHRELPFDLSQVEKLQPRLQNARKLIAENKVRIGTHTATQIEAFVSGSSVEHRVRLTADNAKCTCPWFAKHAATRGPCKHIVAARIMLENTADE